MDQFWSCHFKGKNKMYFDKQMVLISENVVKDILSDFEAWSYFKLEGKGHFGFDEQLFHNRWFSQKSSILH